MTEWAICLERTEAMSTARLRCLPEIRVCESDQLVWLRGPKLDDDIDLQLRSVGGARRFEVLPDGLLRRVDQRLPGPRLPDGPWMPIVDWLAVSFPPTAYPER